MTAVLMSRPPSPRSVRAPGPQTVWTLVGASAIPLWAMWPLFAVISTGSMPVFQFLTIIFSVSALTLFALRRSHARGTPHSARSSWRSTLFSSGMVAIGILLSNILFLLAIRYMPAAQANLIVYLWPLMIALLAVPFRLIMLRKHHFVSVALGLCGAALVIGPGSAQISWLGIGFAAASGFAWALFCVFRMLQRADAPDALPSGMALSAVLSAIVHLATEPTVMPSSAALLSAILNGAVPLALGNLAWDHGLRRGNRALLTVFAYATPLVSALILIAFGYAEASFGLLVGGLMIVIGSAISTRR